MESSGERLPPSTLAYAALSAVDAGETVKARHLMARVQAGRDSSLLLATDDVVVGHIGKCGPVPIPDVLTAATPAQRAAEPTCLAFLGVQALQRRDVMAAVHYLEEGLAANADGSSLMLQLAKALQLRVTSAQSAVPAEDLRRIEELARRALDQRRLWSGPSWEPLAVLMRRHAQVGAFEQATRLGTPIPEGEAQDSEASADEIVILGIQISLALRDLRGAREFASRAGSDHARTMARALLAEPDLPAGEQADLWKAALTDAAPQRQGHGLCDWVVRFRHGDRGWLHGGHPRPPAQRVAWQGQDRQAGRARPPRGARQRRGLGPADRHGHPASPGRQPDRLSGGDRPSREREP